MRKNVREKATKCSLTLSCIMLQNSQTYFKNLAVFTPQDFKSMFDHFTTLCTKGLKTTEVSLDDDEHMFT